ncbi:putative ribonuclease H-like domain-containing protein [Tanacetum coccineum]
MIIVKQSLLTKSQLEGYLKANTKVISDLKVKEEKDIDKMIEMDKQFASDSNISTEPSELMSEPVVNKSNVECQPKDWSNAPIIEEYESDSEDEYVSIPTKEQETPSFANHLNHLIKDCDFHEKRMARKAELNNGWNNVQRVNKQNQFVPSAVLTRTGKIPVSTARTSGTKNVSTARQSFNRQTVLTSTAMKINIVKPNVSRVRPTNVFHKTHSPSSRPFKQITVLSTNFSKQKVNTAKVKVVSTVEGKRETAVKSSAGCNWRPQRYIWHNDYLHRALKNKGIVDSGCSGHMTGNKAYLAEFQDFNGGPVAFGGSKGYITGKGKIKTGEVDFEDVCFVKELQHFNLFSVSQMCDKKNKVLFTDSECLVLSPEFKLPDENQVLLKIPRQNNMYSFNLENIVPSGGLACLIAKATTDESNKWHRRLGHVNFKNLNKLVKGNLVRGLPSKIFQNDHTCVACQKGKQHKASCKAKSVSSISHSLQLLHMDLFGPTSVRSLNHKTYCLVITDDFSRFSWVFFLRTKDETSGILKDFIRQIENQLNQKVKTIRCDNGTEFKNKDVIEFCGSKGIKREYSNARTPQQNGVAERKNRTLIEAARTMLADSFLPNTFWAEAVSTACYVLNRDQAWLFDLDYLTDSYELSAGFRLEESSEHPGSTEANHNAGTEDILDAGEDESAQDCFVLPIWSSYSSTITPYLKTYEKREGTREEEQVFLDKPCKDFKRDPASALIHKLEIVVECYYYSHIKDDRLLSFNSSTRRIQLSSQTRSKVNKSSEAMLLLLCSKAKEKLSIRKLPALLPFGKRLLDKKCGLFEIEGCERSSCQMRNKARIEAIRDLFSLCLLTWAYSLSTGCYKVVKFMGYIKLPQLDEEANDVDVHLYRSMIGSLMYLTASRPDIMFAVYACSRFQVTPKSSHLSAVKRIFSHKVVRLGINPMIQPEPEDLPKDNPKLEIAVLRMSMLVKVIRSQDGIDDKDNDKGSKSRSQSMKEQAYNKEQRERPRPHELNDKSNLIDLMKECHQ